jgi:predicted O-methyltransferase YrrM
MSQSAILITAGDTQVFELVRGTIQSMRERAVAAPATIGFFDLGCSAEELKWLKGQVDVIEQPQWEFRFPDREQVPSYFRGLLARPFLRRYFPGFDIYFWIDADAWVQEWLAVDLFLRGAAKRGAALVPELDRASRFQYGGLPGYWEWAASYYEAAFGKEVAAQVRSYPMLNAGVFALHKDTPHWEEWAQFLNQGLQRSAYSMTDQIALNVVVYGRGLLDKTELLPAWCNWTCHSALPAWDPVESRLVEPYLPHTPIGILHLTREKFQRVRLPTTNGDALDVSLRYHSREEQRAGKQAAVSRPLFPPGDYVAAGLALIQADPYFPNMIQGEKASATWPYLRREVPHNWYVDKRHPMIGFLNRDEAHILYNTALSFKGKRALEIGCWMGWSACHLALAGVLLDVVDPLLGTQEFYETVTNSLRAAGALGSVNLVGGPSPEKVMELAERHQRRWALIFIDGNHDAPGPLRDAMASEKFAEPDAAVVFHDLVSPDVAEGLNYFREKGWSTLVYQTMQIMGIAWRGKVTPVQHRPDPAVNWTIPSHLAGYHISGVRG